LTVRYLSLVRKLKPELFEAVRAEAHVALMCATSAEQWSEYLRRARASRYTYYGEDLDSKFPRPVAPTADRSAKAHGTRSAQKFQGAASGGGARTPAAAADLASEAEDRRHLRQIVQAFCPKAAGSSSAGAQASPPLSTQKLREFVLHCACHPAFADRLVMVCQDCCLSINQAEMAQSKKDLDDCTAPLDYTMPPPLLVTAARHDLHEDSSSTLSSLVPSGDLSHLVTTLQTKAQRQLELDRAHEDKAAQTEAFKRRSRHILSGDDDGKVVAKPDPRKVATALSELRDALRPDWQKRGLSMNIKRSVSIIKRTPSRSKTVKDLMASSAGAFASLKDLLEPPDSASGNPLRTSSARRAPC